MIRPVFALIADSVIIDQSTNQVSIINLVEQLHPAGYPLVVPRITVFAMFERLQDDDSTAEARVRILMDKDTLYDDNLEVDFGDSLLQRSLLQFQGFLLPSAGDLLVRVGVGRNSVKSYVVSAFPTGATPTVR